MTAVYNAKQIESMKIEYAILMAINSIAYMFGANFNHSFEASFISILASILLLFSSCGMFSAVHATEINRCEPQKSFLLSIIAIEITGISLLFGNGILTNM